MPAAHGPRILLLAVDGLEWNVMLPLLRDGKLPNIEALMQRGVYGKLATIPPAKSPVIWTTVGTGKTPDKHGILDFYKPNPGGRPISYTSQDRKTKAVWNILYDLDRSAAVIGWWNTFPVDPIQGVMVAQTNTFEAFRETGIKKGMLVRGVEGQVFPPARQDEMLAIVDQVNDELPGLIQTVYGDVAPQSSLDKANWEACTWSLRADESYRRIALRLAAEPGAYDLFTVYFGATDVVGHRFWRYHEPTAFKYPPTADEVRRLGHVINATYIRADAAIGELIAAFPKETTVFLVSDHGMHANNTESDFVVRGRNAVVESGNHLDGPPGVLIAAGPPIRQAAPARPLRDLARGDLPDLGKVADITPTLLGLMKLPIGRDMDGQVLTGLFESKFEERFDVDVIATHDTAEWLIARGQTPVNVPGEEERQQQLDALGYLTKKPASTQPAVSGSP